MLSATAFAWFQCVIFFPSTQLALKVEHNSYALIFGFNTFLALVLQTILTLIVADEHVLNLPIRTQVSRCSGASILEKEFGSYYCKFSPISSIILSKLEALYCTLSG